MPTARKPCSSTRPAPPTLLTLLTLPTLLALLGVQGCDLSERASRPTARDEASPRGDAVPAPDAPDAPDTPDASDALDALDAPDDAGDRAVDAGARPPGPDAAPAELGLSPADASLSGDAPGSDTAAPADAGGAQGPVNPIDPSLPLIWSSQVLGVDKTGPTSRWSIGKAPDGKTAVVFSIKKGTPVDPFSNSVVVDARAVKKLIAETDWWFQAGYAHPAIGQKLWGVFGGCGASGGQTCNRAPHSNPYVTNAEFEGGWSLRNLVGSKVSWLRAYAYSRNRYDLGGEWAPSSGKLFGKTFGGEGTSYPKGYDGAWMKVSLVLQMNSPQQADGWLAIYLNRALVRHRGGVLWQYEPAKVKGLLYRISHMYGGNPPDAVPTKDQLEWARDARIWASFY